LLVAKYADTCPVQEREHLRSGGQGAVSELSALLQGRARRTLTLYFVQEIEKLAVCRVMRPFVTTKVSVPNLTLEAADSHAHSTYAKSS
jgi:hypothetical protein